MANTQKIHRDEGEYNKMKKTSVQAVPGSGYPNNTANTQTKATRGNGAAQRGTKMSKNTQ